MTIRRVALLSFAVASAVDQGLRGLDPHAELKRLRLEDDALRGEAAPGVARAVSGREDHGRGLQRRKALGRSIDGHKHNPRRWQCARHNGFLSCSLPTDFRNAACFRAISRSRSCTRAPIVPAG